MIVDDAHRDRVRAEGVAADCDHDWQIVEVNFSSRGAERALECACGAVQYEPAQAAVQDGRPPLD